MERERRGKELSRGFRRGPVFVGMGSPITEGLVWRIGLRLKSLDANHADVFGVAGTGS